MSDSHYGENPDEDFSEAEPLIPNLSLRLMAERDAAYAMRNETMAALVEMTAKRNAALTRAGGAEKALAMVTAFSAATDEILLQTTRDLDVLRDAVWHMVTTIDDTQPQTDVDKVIDQLDRRIIGTPERQKLRGALDRADAPDKSRAGQDAAVGKALRL